MAVIPAHEAAATVGDVVRGLRGAVPGIEVIVVDDGSTDATAEEARRAGARVVRHAENRGKGAALESGFDAALGAGAERVLALDADGQHDPAVASRLLGALEGADVVVGTRNRDRAGMPWIRRATNTVTTWFVSRLAGRPLDDTQSGYRAFRAEPLRAVRPKSRRFEYESEFLIAAARAGFRIASEPVPTLYNAPASHIHPIRDTGRFIRLVLRHLFR